MFFSEREKSLAGQLKESGLAWNPEEGDWFWSQSDWSHQFYLGESLPSSFSFRAGQAYVFDSSMTWHLQHGGLKLDSLIWLPTWSQGRGFLKKRGFKIRLLESDDKMNLEAFREDETFSAEGEGDLEALYSVMLQMVKKG